MSIKWHGKEVKKDMNRAIKAGLTASGMVVQSQAKLLCPVDTGRLRNSIIFKIKGHSAFVGTNVEYAPHIEYGTVKMPPKSFLRAAIDEQRESIPRIFNREFKKVFP